jgi:DNA-binding SARP family transcriptional activator
MTEQRETLDEAITEVERANVELRLAAGRLDEAVAKLTALVEIEKVRAQ